MSQSNISESWVSKSERFARQEAQIRQVLAMAEKPLDMIELLRRFKDRFRYLPVGYERRVRHLIEEGYVVRNDGAVPTFELKK